MYHSNESQARASLLQVASTCEESYRKLTQVGVQTRRKFKLSDLRQFSFERGFKYSQREIRSIISFVDSRIRRRTTSRCKNAP
jgi:Tfp pilus assembly protein PilE